MFTLSFLDIPSTILSTNSPLQRIENHLRHLPLSPVLRNYSYFRKILTNSHAPAKHVIMIKTLGNLVLFIWSKTKISSNLAAENFCASPTIGRNEKDEQAAEDSNDGSTLLGFAFPNLEFLARSSRHCKAGYRCPLAPQGFRGFRTNHIEPDAPDSFCEGQGLFLG